MGVAFAQRLTSFGEAPALIFKDGRVLSYRELGALVAACAESLGPGRQLILLEASCRQDSIVTYLAALQAGHPVMLVAPGDEDHKSRLIETYQPNLIAGMRDGTWKIESLGQRTQQRCHSDLALLLSTSGSTGSAKLVRLSAKNLDANAAAIAEFLDISSSDRAALVLPLHYSYGLSVLHSHLTRGASIYLSGQSVIDDGFLENLRQSASTNLAGVPYTYELLEQIGFRRSEFPDLRFMTVAGGKLPGDLVRIYADHLRRRSGKFFVMYGQTEATARIAYLPPELAASQGDCIGEAIPGGELSLVDDEGEEISGIGAVGELLYRGPNVMMGYATSIDDLAKGSEVAALATGDLAERMAPDLYRIVGRKNRFSKIAGLRLSHDDIQSRLSDLGIAAAVLGDDREISVAITGGNDPKAVRAKVSQLTGLPHTFIRVEWVRSLPRNAAGKVCYATLHRKMGAGGRDRTEDAAEKSISEAFAWIFAPRVVRPEDSFRSLGGDSLSYLQLTLSLEKLISHLPANWEQLSIAELQALAHNKRPVPHKTTLNRVKSPPPWFAALKLGQSLDANFFLRAVAILLIVTHHATHWPLAGGAAALLVLIGYNLARFQSEQLFAGRTRAMLTGVARHVALYYGILLIYCTDQGRYPWQSLVLLGNWGIDGYSTLNTALIQYWFVEAYAQIALLVALLFSVPRLAAFISRHAFAAGVAFLLASIGLRLATPVLWDAGEMSPYVTARVLYLPVVGWCIWFADSKSRRIWVTGLLTAMFVVLPWIEQASATILWVRAGILVAAVWVLLWCPKLRLPRAIAVAAVTVAAASYSIYLFHNVPFYMMLSESSLPQSIVVPLHIILGIGAGCLAHFLLSLGRARWAELMLSLMPRRIETRTT